MNFDVTELGPYERLWFSVLYQAMDDATSFTVDKITLSSARQWFRSERNEVGSFIWVCDVINLDHETVLQRVRKKLRERKRQALRESAVHGGDG